MADARLAVTPPDQSDGRTRSAWGDFGAEAERAVASALLAELSHGVEIADAITPEIVAAQDAGLSAEAGERLVKLLGSDDWSTEELFPLLVQLLYFSRNTSVLKKYRVVHPAYRVFDDHYQNAEEPGGAVAQVSPSPNDRRWRFLSRDISFPIGVGASSLTTNSTCVQRLFRNGYSVVTYKTVRSRSVAPFSAPNWTFLSPRSSDLFRDSDSALTASTDVVGAGLDSTANSFGVPSYSPDVWQADFRAAQRAVGPGDLLICSVLGEDYSHAPTTKGLTDDFKYVAQLAADAGATAIELNLSCPNTLSAEGGMKPALCRDVALTTQIVRSVRATLPAGIKLGAKLASMDAALLTEVLTGIGNYVDFVCGINTMPRRIVDSDGRPIFPGREQAGVGGAAIADSAVEFVAQASQVRLAQQMSFEIVGLGGVTDVASFERLYNAGADVVQSVSGVFRNTLLAQDCVQALGATLPSKVTDHLRQRVVQAVAQNGTLPEWRIYASIAEDPAVISSALGGLVEAGVVNRLTHGAAGASPEYSVAAESALKHQTSSA